VPSAIFSPWSMTVTVADPHDDAHVVLDQEDGQVQLGLDPAEEGHHGGRLGRVHSGSRLVEQQQLRFGRQRPGDLEAPLVAVGEVPGELIVPAGRPTYAASRRASGGGRFLANLSRVRSRRRAGWP
jgi:hypothetical protein